MNGWPVLSVGQLQIEQILFVEDGNHGNDRPRPDEFSESGMAFIRAADIVDRRIAFHRASRINETARQRIRKGFGRPLDVLLTHKGTVGKVALAPADSPPFVCSPQTTFWRSLDHNQLVPQYLRYYMESPEFARQLDARSGETDMAAYVSLTEQRRLAVRVPPIATQRSIADTLGALDDKIESNRRAATLELALAATVLASGTEAIRVGDIADVDKGLSYKGSGLDDGSATDAIPMVNLANFTTSGALKPDGLKYYTGDFKPKHRLAAWDLVVANTDLTQSREILGRAFLLPTTLHGALHTHHTSVLRFHERSELVPFLWAELQSPEFRDRAKGFATGTTVTALPGEALLDFDFSVPSDPEPALAAARGLIEHSWQLATESDALTTTRDALLPELLSGRIRVPEAAAVVQDGIE